MNTRKLVIMVGLIAICVVVSLVSIMGYLKYQDVKIDTAINYHTITCIDDYGNLRQFEINIPVQVQDVEAYSKGFCKSLRTLN